MWHRSLSSSDWSRLECVKVMKTGFEKAEGKASQCGKLLVAALLFSQLLAVGQAQVLANPEPATIRPFKAHVPDQVLVDLRCRLAETKWPDQLPGTTWEYGADIKKVRELAEYWQNGYDWRAQETKINRFDQFTTEIDGQQIYFIHQRSLRPDAIPLLLIHGWPGSILEFLALIEPLTDPKESHSPAFDVVIPSLPGFGFSGLTTTGGVGAAADGEGPGCSDGSFGLSQVRYPGRRLGFVNCSRHGLPSTHARDRASSEPYDRRPAEPRSGGANERCGAETVCVL